MAVNIRHVFPLQQAKARRDQLGRYLQLDGGRFLIAAAVIFALMSLISLGQTGRLATQGYAISELQREQTLLIRERSALQLRLTEAQSLMAVQRKAANLKLRPMTPDQAEYITIAPSTSDVISATSAPSATEQPNP